MSQTSVDSTDARLRQAAAELFASRGYGGASMSELAARVGVRKASLYHHYGSKEELLLDLFERALEDWKEASRPALERDGTYRERLFGHLEAAVAFVTAHPHEVAVIRLAATQIGGDLGRRVMQRLEVYEKDHQECMEAFFAQAAEAGEIVSGDPRVQALFWKAFLDGLLLNEIYAPPGKGRFGRRLEELWGLFWNGLTAEEGA